MLLAPQERSASFAARPARQVWLATGACLVAAAVALGLVFHDEATAAFHVWRTSTAYNHCFLILPVAIYLAWQRRDRLAAINPEPTFLPLVLVVPLALLWMVAAMVGVVEGQQLAAMAMFQAIALAVVGPRVYRLMLTPFLYLFFLVPFGYFLVPTLQHFTAWFTVEGLRLVDIPVYWDGTLIEIPAGRFVVAEACAGLRFLIASVAFGVFFAALMYKSRLRWIGFVALSVIVPVIANGFRAFGLLVLAELSGSTTAVMADHIIYGWVFFTFVTFILILIGMSFADARSGSDTGLAAPLATGARPATGKLVAAAAVGIVLALIVPAYAQFTAWHAAAVDFATAAPPGVGAAWQPTTLDTHWAPDVIGPDRIFLQEFGQDGARVVRYVALYRIGGLHDNFARGLNRIADFNDWRLVGTGKAQATIAGRRVTVGTTEIQGGGRRLQVWDFYLVDGAIVSGRVHAKLRQLEGLLGRQSPIAAYIAIAADDGDPRHPAAAALRQFLASMPPLAPYLAAVAGRTARTLR